MPSVTLLPPSVTPCPVSVLVPFTAPAPDSRRMRKSDPGPRESHPGPGAMRGSHHSGDFVSVSLVKYVIKLKRKRNSNTRKMKNTFLFVIIISNISINNSKISIIPLHIIYKYYPSFTE